MHLWRESLYSPRPGKPTVRWWGIKAWSALMGASGENVWLANRFCFSSALQALGGGKGMGDAVPRGPLWLSFDSEAGID